MRTLVAAGLAVLAIFVAAGCGGDDDQAVRTQPTVDPAALVASAGYEEWATLDADGKRAVAEEYLAVGPEELTAGLTADDLIAFADEVYAADGDLEGGDLKGMLGIAAAEAGLANIIEDTPDEPAEEAKGEYDSLCDYLLNFSGSTPDYRFVAEATLRNTGNVGTISRVTAIWDQIGTDPVKVTKTVRVQAGGRKRVTFDVAATQDQIDRHQSADGGCRVRSTIRDTF